MLKLEITYDDGTKKIVKVEAPNQRDAKMIALRPLDGTNAEIERAKHRTENKNHHLSHRRHD